MSTRAECEALTKEQIKVMNHFANGGRIKLRTGKGDIPCDDPSWNWAAGIYLIDDSPRTKKVTMYKWVCQDCYGLHVSSHSEKRPANAIKRLDETMAVFEVPDK